MNQSMAVFNGTINSEQVQLVNLRELHSFLEVKDNFSDWIKGRIQQYGFIENQDFIILSEKSDKFGRGRPRIEYHGTIEMAKELSMVENNHKGKEARAYFRDCEKQAKASIAGQLESPAKLIRVKMVTEEDIKQLTRAMYPKKEHEDDHAPWFAFYKQFSVKYIDDLPESRLNEALEWINALPSPHCKERKTTYREQEFDLLCRDIQYHAHASKLMSERAYGFLNGTTSVETLKTPIWEMLKPFMNILGLGSSKQRVF